MQPEGIDNVLVEVLQPKCLICREPVDYNTETAVSCCDSIFHKECLEDSHSYHTPCPNCECIFYKQNNTTAVLQRTLNRSMSKTELYDLYKALYKKDPTSRLLREVDRYFRKNCNSYNKLFIGYYPITLFEPNNVYVDMETFKKRWDDFSYGIFRSFHWDKFVIAGPTVLALTHQSLYDHITPETPIHFVICDSDYRIIRDSVRYMFTYLKVTLECDALLTITNDVITIFIPGMVRRICIDMKYTEDIFWVLYGVDSYRPYMIMYDGDTVYTSVRCLVESHSSFKMPKLGSIPENGIPCLGYQESLGMFCDRTHITCVSGYSEFLRSVLKSYKLCIKVAPKVNPITKHMLTALTSVTGSLSNFIDVEMEDDEEQNTYCISVCAIDDPNENLVYHGNITLTDLQDFVLKSYPYHKKSITVPKPIEDPYAA